MYGISLTQNYSIKSIKLRIVYQLGHLSDIAKELLQT